MLLDFYPHAVRYIGARGDHSFVRLEQYPILLEVDARGALVGQWRLEGKDTPLPPDASAPVRLESEQARFFDDGSFGWMDGDTRVRVALSISPLQFDFQSIWRQDEAFVIAGREGSSLLLRIPFAARPEKVLVVPRVQVTIEEPPLEDGTAFFVGERRVMIEHPTRGRFWFEECPPGLAKGDPVKIGDFVSRGRDRFARTLVVGDVVVRNELPVREPLARELVVGERQQGEPRPREPKPPSESLSGALDRLVELGLLVRPSPEELAAFLEDQYPDGSAGERVDHLLTLLGVLGRRSDGVVCLDHRFGNDTDDVVRDLTQTLADEPITFALAGMTDESIRVKVGDRIHVVGMDLEQLAKLINRSLAEVGGKKRVFAIDTQSDEHLFVTCAPETADRLEREGIRFRKTLE